MGSVTSRSGLDRTFDVVLETLIGHPGVTIDDIQSIADQVSGMEDREAKRARILDLADALAVRSPDEIYAR